jgi:hypothetical protein
MAFTSNPKAPYRCSYCSRWLGKTGRAFLLKPADGGEERARPPQPQWAPKGLGFIIRTAGQDRNKKELQGDLSYLSRLWQVVAQRIRASRSPAEIYQESDMVTRTIRDIFTGDIDTIWVDEKNAYGAHPAVPQERGQIGKVAAAWLRWAGH